MRPPNILFLTLKIFSATGGIEKVCRIVGKAIYDQSIVTGGKISIFSMHDSCRKIENKYFAATIYRAFEEIGRASCRERV